MVKTYMKYPNGQLVEVKRVRNTKFIQGKDGRMRGRRAVKSGGDTMRLARATGRFTVVRKSKNARGHVRQTRTNYRDGNILGFR